MAKERIFNLPETKGNFEVSGKVFGTKKDEFEKNIKTKNGKEMKIVKFGVEYADGCNVFPEIKGMESDYVYFSKKAETKGEKATVEKVKWSDRFSFNKEGFRLIGKNIGVKKIVNEKGKEVNDKKVLSDFDAAKEIAENLADDKFVYIRGDLEYSHYKNDSGDTRRKTTLTPSQVSLCSDIDFKAEDFKPKNNFSQVIIFMGIEKEKENDKETGRAIVSAKIVTYNTIEDTEFIIEDTKLMGLFRKNLKPYTAIKVSGHMVSSIQTEEVKEEDEWGEGDTMKKVSTPVKREFIITGATPSTIDKETYSTDKVEDALVAIANNSKEKDKFESSTDTSDDGWGDIENLGDDDIDWE